MAKENIKVVYDNCSLLVKQAKAEALKNKGMVSETILSKINDEFNKVIDFEKMHLIMAHDKLYGTILMNMEIKVDLNQNGKIDLLLDKDPFTLSLNPLHIFDENYKFSETTGLIISEIYKLIYEHPKLYSEINPEADPKKHAHLEEASDASSNSMVKYDVRIGDGKNNLRIHKTAHTPSDVHNNTNVSVKEKESLNYYYNILERFDKRKTNDGNQQSNQSGNASQQNNQSGNCPSFSGSGNGNPTHQWEKIDKDDVSEGTKTLISNALNSLSEKDRGLIPSGLLSQINTLLAPPEINWKQVLRKMVGSVPVPYRKTRMRLNRRQPERADLYGKIPKRTVNIICAFDTSGSMSDDDISYCMNEVFNIIKVYEGASVTIIECDAEINNIYDAKNISQVHTKVGGRGGTSFIPVIDFVNGNLSENSKWTKHPKYGKCRDTLLVYFTDGYGDFEIEKPKTYRNLWVVLQDVKCLSLKEPYGDVKSLTGDKDFRKGR